MTGLVEVGRYRRDLGAARARAVENALDWEHLPHLHGGSFSRIEVIDHGLTGWQARAWLGDGRPVELDLRLSEEGWITSTRVEGRLAAEVRTVAEATGENSCRVAVTFHAPDKGPDRNAAAGAYYRRLYARLYDEDERMMIARAEALRRGPAALRLSRSVTLADGSMHLVPLFCPHQGLPLDAEPDAAGILACPWHGYRFDVRTGRCISGQAAGWAIEPPRPGWHRPDARR